nr:reverse transcriptase domain-containing protein [Tanacetum cinerariifolium]
MIIKAEIEGHFIHQIYVDGGSASEILYEHCFSRLRPEVKNQMVPATTPLIGFSEEIIWPMGKISLLVKIGDENSTSTWMNFIVVRSPSPYNGIIGRPGDQQPSAITRSAKEIIKVAVHPEYPEQTIAIGSTLTEEGQKELCGLLRRNLDIFAWKPADITGVLRHIAEHRLSVREGCSPVRQNKRIQAPERNKAMQKEVEKLVDASIMKEVHFHSWLSNPILVKKHDDSWRMRSNKHNFDDEKGWKANANLFCQSCFTRKAVEVEHQTDKNIFPGTSNHCHDRPANQADIIKIGSRRKTTEVEHQNGRV